MSEGVMSPEQIDRCNSVMRRALNAAGLEDVEFRVYRQSDWTDGDGVTWPGEWVLEMRKLRKVVCLDRPDLYADEQWIDCALVEAIFQFEEPT